MNKLLVYLGVIGGVLLFFSCYNNNKDITKPIANGLETISFRDDIVPIVTSGACGCHINGKISNAVPFAIKDTIYFGAIQSRSTVFDKMAKGADHPGEGGIFFTPAQAEIIKTWVAQGAKDNYVPPAITGPVTYTSNIVPIYKQVCKGSACHGGVGPNLDYAKMVSDKDQLSQMMGSSGANGHKGGPLSIDATTSSTFLAWITQGQPL